MRSINNGQLFIMLDGKFMMQFTSAIFHRYGEWHDDRVTLDRFLLSLSCGYFEMHRFNKSLFVATLFAVYLFGSYASLKAGLTWDELDKIYRLSIFFRLFTVRVLK